MLFFRVVLGFILLRETVLAYNQNACCELAKSEGAFIGNVPPIEN
jgi:hypothetical protein